MAVIAIDLDTAVLKSWSLFLHGWDHRMLSFLMFYKRIAYISVVGNHREYQGFRGYQRDLGDHGGLVVLCVQVVLDDLLALEGNAFVNEKNEKQMWENIRKSVRNNRLKI